MDPLSPNDPLWNLLGKARSVEPRSNFTQNVLRAARQTPQTRGWWAALSAWFADTPAAVPRLALATAAVVVAATLVAVQVSPSLSSSSPDNLVATRQTPPAVHAAVTVAEPPLVAVETQLESIEQVGALLALENASALTDREINFLLY